MEPTDELDNRQAAREARDLASSRADVLKREAAEAAACEEEAQRLAKLKAEAIREPEPFEDISPPEEEPLKRAAKKRR